MTPIGYNGINLGLTNQKIAFIGLVHRARKENRPVCLPPFLSYEIDGTTDRIFPFREVFRVPDITRILNAFSIKWTLDQDFEAVDGWHAFMEGAGIFGATGQQGPAALTGLTCQLVHNLRPTDTVVAIKDQINRKIYQEMGIHFCVQMRIEKDWEAYTSTVLETASGKDERNLPTPDEIIIRTRALFGRDFSSAYVLCDERNLPASKETIRESILHRHNVRLYWKSDFISTDTMENLPLSMVDFEVALASPFFIGTSRSTFSCFVGFEKFCRQRASFSGHYIYNAPGQRRGERRDNGPGRDPAAACEALYRGTPLFAPPATHIHVAMTLQAHIAIIGDFESTNHATRGLHSGELVAGTPDAPPGRHIEGFAFHAPDTSPMLEYRVLLHDNTWSDWHRSGTYAGTRGQSLPIRGFGVRVTGPAMLNTGCIYAGRFSDTQYTVMAHDGENCQSRSGQGKLLCITLYFYEKHRFS